MVSANIEFVYSHIRHVKVIVNIKLIYIHTLITGYSSQLLSVTCVEEDETSSPSHFYICIFINCSYKAVKHVHCTAMVGNHSVDKR